MNSTDTADSIWDLLGESYDETLPGRTAIALKPTDSTILYAYPAPRGTIGWLLDDGIENGYDETPTYQISIAPWMGPGFVVPLPLADHIVESQRYSPDLVQRTMRYSYPGLRVQETFCRAVEGAFTWRLDFQHLALQDLEKSMYVTLRAFKGLGEVRADEEQGQFRLGDLTLSAPPCAWGTFDSLEDAHEAISAGRLAESRDGSRYLVLEFKLKLKAKGSTRLSLGLSFSDVAAARKAREADGLESPIRERWDAWLRSLPAPRFANAGERRAYYKCWWVVRLNYYQNPRFGHMVCEALPVYRGYWLWGLDASEWHSDQDTDFTSEHIRRALDLFLDYQREDGYITHAIYLEEEEPGSGWGSRSITQTPHIPWVCLRYAEATGDYAPLKEWYPKLVRFYRYLCESRDAAFRNLHLWAILTSFDTGLDTTSAFQRVTYGENGVKENYCYPAIYAAERCRFEQALARMAEILGTGESAQWVQEAQRTRQAMDQHLWDPSRGWYGVLHEDGSLDVRVGVDGLFPFAYGLVSAEKAAAARDNFRRLIDQYGVHSVAPGELGYEADHYWRGPAWAKPCAMGIAAARNYFPDLQDEAAASTVRMLLRWPNVWECLNAETGEVARADQGMIATPLISSNVGAGEAMGALLTVRGVDMMRFDGVLQLAAVRNFHWGGMRLDVEEHEDGWTVRARAAERQSGDIRFALPDGSVRSLSLEAGKSVTIETCW